VADLEKAVASVRELTTPTLEFVVVNPQGSAEPRVVRAEVGADLGAVDDRHRAELASKVRAAIDGALHIDAAVEILDREALPRSGYKLKRLVDV
jgi:hypothetical protein